MQFGVAISRVSMANLPIEIIEEIVKIVDLRDLIGYRIVSKPWDSLITTPEFIKSHLDHIYQRESENDKIASRRSAASMIVRM